ncbi:MAG: 3D domain-containing protein [Oceanidesulfovibrio sp.]
MFRSLLKYTQLPALLVVCLYAAHQQRIINELTADLDTVREQYRTLEVAQAGAEGALQGLAFSTDLRSRVLGSSLAENKALVHKLYSLLQDKEHMIQSLSRGRMLTVTAYSPTVGQTDSTPFTTASNCRVRDGIVAVSRDLFSKGWRFGRSVYVKGMGVYTIEDLMHSRKKNQVDIFMFDTQEALKFGRRKLRVYLLGS